LIGGTEATGHEAEAKLQKKTQQHQVRLRLADLEHAKAAVTLRRSEFSFC